MLLRSLALLSASLPLFAVDMVPAIEARHEMHAARLDHAAHLYSALLKADPTWAPGYYGLVRSLLEASRVDEACAAAEAARKWAPDTAPTEGALGMISLRRGDVAQAERHFRLAIQIDSHDAGALLGLAEVLAMSSQFTTVRNLYQSAYSLDPGDPKAIVAGLANQREGWEHVVALERALAIYDPDTPEARELKAHIASDKAAGDRKLRRLLSPYKHYDLKLVPLLYGPSATKGVGLRVDINGRKLTLKLDTGTSGISISPEDAHKAGLERLGEEVAEARGVGDKAPVPTFSFLAPHVKIGDLEFADVPIDTLDRSSMGGGEGLIGTDVFRQFLVSIDAPNFSLSLGAFLKLPPERLPDAGPPAPGFTRAFRIGNHMTLSTSINGSGGHLFLLDSGASTSLIDSAVARETTTTYEDPHLLVRGIQGSVHGVSRANEVKLDFGGISQVHRDLIAFDMSRMGDDMGVHIAGLLGMPVVQQLRITINYVDGSIRLQTPE